MERTLDRCRSSGILPLGYRSVGDNRHQVDGLGTTVEGLRRPPDLPLINEVPGMLLTNTGCFREVTDEIPQIVKIGRLRVENPLQVIQPECWQHRRNRAG